MTEAPPRITIHPEDPDDEWQTTSNSGRTVRVGLLTGGLVLLLVLAGGFWGGVVAEKHHGTGSSAGTSAAARFAAAARAAAGTGSAGSGAFGLGGGANATTGTVIDVQGNVIDISDASGNIVKITVGSSTTITRTAPTPASGVRIGDTVVVTGSPSAPTAVRASAPGTRAGGGFSLGGGG